MILTEVFGNIAEMEDIDSYHVETCMVKSDDLAKRILRVTSDHGSDYGIRLDDESAPLSNGAVFLKEPGCLVALSVIADEMIVIEPDGIDQMGIVAHFLGNMHKPISVKGGAISLMRDPVVESSLEVQGIPFRIEELSLDEPLRHVDMAEGHHHEHGVEGHHHGPHGHDHGEHHHGPHGHDHGDHHHGQDSHHEHHHGPHGHHEHTEDAL